MEYLLKASAIIFIFYVCYKLFLQRDTFFEWNRGFLFAGLITAFTIPFIVIPIYIERAPVVFESYSVGDVSFIPDSAEQTFTTLQLLTTVYLLGVIVFFVRFAIQIFSLVKIIYTNKSEKNGDYRFVKTTQDISPFSFFNWIVYNPDLFEKNELEQIITHEKVHANQHHSIDILLTQLSCIALWFNPFVWLYNKDLKQNLEFIADQNAQNKSNCKKSYQYTLLKTSMPMQQVALTNNFYNSLIKKRIVMLHKSKSKKINQLKYILIIPILAIFLMSFNTKKVYIDKEIPALEHTFINDAIIQEADTEPVFEGKLITDTEKNVTKKLTSKAASKQVQNTNKLTSKTNFNLKSTAIKSDDEMVFITKDYTEADFDKVVADLKSKGITIKFKGIKRNKSGEITAIKIDVSSDSSSANYSVSSDEPIKPVKVSFDEDGNSISIGNGVGVHYGVSKVSFNSDDGKVIKFDKSGKGKNSFTFFSDDDEHEFHGDTIHFSAKGGKEKNKFVFISDGKHKSDRDTIYLSKDGKKAKHIVVKGYETAKVISNHFEDDDENKLTISGTVKADDGQALPGVNVIINGKSIGTATDFDGKFKIKTSKGENLIFSHIGFDPKHVNIKKNTDLNIILSESANVVSKSVSKLSFSNNDEKPLIIIDGKETKTDINNIAPNTIKSVTILKDKSATKKYGEKAKDGVILISTKDSGENEKSFKVKKISSKISVSNIDKDKQPLIVIDGKIVKGKKLKDIDSDTIESVSVLKGESATKKYGKKAKDGVIEITTKKKE